MLQLYLNVGKLDVAKTLGVAAFTRRLAEQLRRLADVSLVVPLDTVLCQQHFAFLPGAKILREGRAQFAGVEILAHHFQTSLTGCPRVTVVHDLHIVDVPWKYSQLGELSEIFVRNATESDAVVTEFPRVFFDLPRVIPAATNSLFLMSSPPLDVDAP